MVSERQKERGTVTEGNPIQCRYISLRSVADPEREQSVHGAHPFYLQTLAPNNKINVRYYETYTIS